VLCSECKVRELNSTPGLLWKDHGLDTLFGHRRQLSPRRPLGSGSDRADPGGVLFSRYLSFGATKRLPYLVDGPQSFAPCGSMAL